jgi:hypothetical protein
MWRWGLRFLANCTEARALANGERSFKLAHYSIAVLKQVREDTQIAYDEVIKGCIRVYGSAEAIDGAEHFYAKLAPLGLNYRVLDAAGCVAIEPALGPSAAKFTGGLFFPDEESGDCHKIHPGDRQRLPARRRRLPLRHQRDGAGDERRRDQRDRYRQGPSHRGSLRRRIGQLQPPPPPPAPHPTADHSGQGLQHHRTGRCVARRAHRADRR